MASEPDGPPQTLKQHAKVFQGEHERALEEHGVRVLQKPNARACLSNDAERRQDDAISGVEVARIASFGGGVLRAWWGDPDDVEVCSWVCREVVPGVDVGQNVGVDTQVPGDRLRSKTRRKREVPRAVDSHPEVINRGNHLEL